jgi:hypothetical protein
MTRPLDLERFKALLAAYGARPERFPETEREAALALLAVSEEARALARAESTLDDVFVRAPAAELSPALARKLAEIPIRRARVEKRSRLAPLATALGWAAAAAFGVIWGARTEALDSAAADPATETSVRAASSSDAMDEADEELIALALGAVTPLEEDP